MGALRYAIPFVALAAAPLGFALGPSGAWLTVAITPVALLSLDALLGEDRAPPAAGDQWLHRLLPRLYIPLQLAVTLWGALTISRPHVGLAAAAGLTASVGVACGVFGMLCAHEMVHSRSRAERGLGLLLLAGVGYMHFRIAHIHGHHRNAASWDDPASARPGESAFAFIPRAIAGQWREAWAFERARLALRGHAAVSPRNRMIQYLAVEAVVAGAVVSLGWRAAAYWAAQAALSIIMLELFNYVAHYGLTRRRLPSGALERIAPRHSWNVSRRMNNWSLFNMGRHADHHRSGSRPYQRLEHVEDAPELPCGYAGAMFLALSPPLWRRVMDGRVAAWNGRETTNAVTPAAAPR
jgi:alkane 1-monooxygenase